MPKYAIISPHNRQRQFVSEAWAPAFVYPRRINSALDPEPLFHGFLDLLIVRK